MIIYIMCWVRAKGRLFGVVQGVVQSSGTKFDGPRHGFSSGLRSGKRKNDGLRLGLGVKKNNGSRSGRNFQANLF